MVTQDAETFVALGRAMSLAEEEGALDADAARDLAAALVAAILTGSMELDTYARLHEALARLLELTFAGAAPRAPRATPTRDPGEDNLGVYLEVIGEAWDKVNNREDGDTRVRAFVHETFDLTHAHFGGECWFEAPLRVAPDQLIHRAKAAGLLIVALEPAPAGTRLTARLCPPNAADSSGCGRVVLGWGARRSNLTLARAA